MTYKLEQNEYYVELLFFCYLLIMSKYMQYC
jgi:hypothetical protein